MNLEIEGKTALVLGAGGGLGSSIAKVLAEEGVRVAVADLNTGAAQATADYILAEGGDALALGWDLTDSSALEANVVRVEKMLGSVDILVNNTGGPPPTSAHAQDASVWMKYFESIVLPVISVTDRLLPGMKERKFGRVITSASSGVIAPIPNLAISNALRMSLVGWSKTLAGEVGRDGVTANVVVPGRIATDRIRYLDLQKANREGRDVSEIGAESTRSIPVGRYGYPREYADVVAFLASARSAYITGSIIRVDGGLIASI